MSYEEFKELWEQIREKYRTEFGEELATLEKLMSVYAYRRSVVGGSSYSIKRLIADVTDDGVRTNKVLEYMRTLTGFGSNKINQHVAPALHEFEATLSNDSVRIQWLNEGKKSYQNYEDERRVKKGARIREKMDYEELMLGRKTIKEPIKEPIEKLNREPDAAPVEIPEEPVNLPAERPMDPTRQSLLDIFDAIRDTKVSAFGTRHDREFDAVWDAADEYEAAIYKASLSNEEIAQEAGDKLYSACKNYLMLHLKVKKAEQSIGGQNTEDGRLRKQAAVRMLELMEKNQLPEFNEVSKRYIIKQNELQKQIPLNFEQLKRNLAEKSKIDSVVLAQRYYAELDQQMERIKQKKQNEKVDFLALSSTKKHKKMREQAKMEFYQNYRNFLAQYPEPQKAEMKKRINSNDISVLKNLKQELGSENEMLKKYLEQRIRNLRIIDRMTERAVQNLQMRKIEEPEMNKTTEGQITRIRLKNVEQPMLQKTPNGCWSVVLSSLLKYRGVNLDQTAIRAYRPIKGSVNSDASNDIANYVDLIHKVIPNAALNHVEIFQQNWGNEPWTSEQQENAKQTAKKQLKKTILTALAADKGPVAFLCHNHYRTLLGLEERTENGETKEYISLYDPLQEGVVTLSLDELMKQCYNRGMQSYDAKGNPVWSGEGYCFTMQWLKDLTDSRGKMLPDENLESQGVLYDQAGKLDEKGKFLTHYSNEAYKTVSWSLDADDDINVMTFLPAKMTLNQKSKNQINPGNEEMKKQDSNLSRSK